jgi:hypothetical protein
MATLRLPFNGMRSWFKSDSATTDSRRARDFASQAYRQTGGATAELKRVYNSYRDNERRREAGRRGSYKA